METFLNVKRLFLVLGACVLALAALELFATSARAACSMNGSQPDSGTLTLQYLHPSSKLNPDRNDYRLSGTIRWNNASALSCFDDGRVDWAYEHNLTYQKHFDRKIWSPDFSDFPSSANPYIDTTASDHGDLTDLTFGLFRPEKLSAGHTYRFSYYLFLPKKPRDNYHSFYLAGQVIERSCWEPGPWCVGTPPFDGSDVQPLIGVKTRFSVTGTTCIAWQKGKSPTACPTPQPTSSPVANPTPSPTPAPTTPTPDPAPVPQPTSPPSTWWEQETPNHPVNTFTNYHNASGMGPPIAAGQWVEVYCKVYDPTIVSVNPDGYWYRIASSPWNGSYYSPANTFMNGDPYGGPYTHNTDFAVPNC
jgi:hypothetical protein